jgi:hypothetical protein
LPFFIQRLRFEVNFLTSNLSPLKELQAHAGIAWNLNHWIGYLLRFRQSWPAFGNIIIIIIIFRLYLLFNLAVVKKEEEKDGFKIY